MAEFVGHEACPSCGSSDNLARYSDGSGHCFGCKHNEPPGESQGVSSFKKGHSMTSNRSLIFGHYQGLGSRKLREETLRKFGYQVGELGDTPCHIAPYRNRGGDIIAQKIRSAGKEFSWLGEPKAVFQLFGQHLWKEGGKRVVVCEGEIDTMTVAQIQDLKWPTVGVPNGSSDYKSIEKASDWLETFDQVVFLFDGDAPGRSGAAQCASVLSPGKAFIAELPDGKDSNDLLIDGRADVVMQAIWNAAPYRPDNVTLLTDLIDESLEPAQWGYSLPACLDTLYKMSFGPQPGQVWIGGAGVGIGKTDIFLECIAHDLEEGRAVATWLGEQPPPETPKRVAGKLHGFPFHRPDLEYDQDILREALKPHHEKLHVYDHRKLPDDWESLKRWIKWIVKVYDVKLVYLDNLTLLTADADDERRYLDKLLKEAVQLASQLQIVIHFLSHLTTPATGKPHEEGGRVEAKQFTGSRAIMRYAHQLWGLERNTQAEDRSIRSVSTFRILKDRFTGQGTGEVFWLRYDPATTLQTECDEPPKEEPKNGLNQDTGPAGEYQF